MWLRLIYRCPTCGRLRLMWADPQTLDRLLPVECGGDDRWAGTTHLESPHTVVPMDVIDLAWITHAPEP